MWVGHRCGPVRTLTLCRVTVPAGRGQIQAPPGTHTHSPTLEFSASHRILQIFWGGAGKGQRHLPHRRTWSRGLETPKPLSGGRPRVTLPSHARRQRNFRWPASLGVPAPPPSGLRSLPGVSSQGAVGSPSRPGSGTGRPESSESGVCSPPPHGAPVCVIAVHPRPRQCPHPTPTCSLGQRQCPLGLTGSWPPLRSPQPWAQSGRRPDEGSGDWKPRWAGGWSAPAVNLDLERAPAQRPV